MGEGEERKKLEVLIARYGLGERVRLAGLVPGGDAYLEAFDIFLHTSRTEALGLAIIEAGLAGLPVVATNVGGIPEIVEDGKTGLLVPPYSPAAITKALQSLLERPDHAKALGEALSASVRERFDYARMIRETLALYTN
jgi:glycosyltransferase involved in cell wall biosynthesis